MPTTGDAMTAAEIASPPSNPSRSSAVAEAVGTAVAARGAAFAPALIVGSTARDAVFATALISVATAA
jgi:hypothetical protein